MTIALFRHQFSQVPVTITDVCKCKLHVTRFTHPGGEKAAANVRKLVKKKKVRREETTLGIYVDLQLSID